MMTPNFFATDQSHQRVRGSWQLLRYINRLTYLLTHLLIHHAVHCVCWRSAHVSARRSRSFHILDWQLYIRVRLLISVANRNWLWQ